MNMPLEPSPMESQAIKPAATKPVLLTMVQLKHAREIATQSRQPLLDVLEEESGLDAEGFMTALGQLMHYPALGILHLYEMTPDFELLPFAKRANTVVWLCMMRQEHFIWCLLTRLTQIYKAGWI